MNPATKFDLWDHQVEEVLPRQKYFGRNKQFSLDNLTDRIILALAKLLQNMGKDPNTFALNIPDDYTDKEWSQIYEKIAYVSTKLLFRKKTKNKIKIKTKKT